MTAHNREDGPEEADGAGPRDEDAAPGGPEAGPVVGADVARDTDLHSGVLRTARRRLRSAKLAHLAATRLGYVSAAPGPLVGVRLTRPLRARADSERAA